MRKIEPFNHRTLLLIALIYFTGVSICQAQAHAKHWSYQGETGPQHWGELESKFTSCKIGKMQSPIDLSGSVVQNGKAPEFHYGELKFGVIDNGHTIQANVEGESFILLEGKRYDLVQIHFHSPSENTLNGKSFPMEGHLVHKAEDGNLAVIGLFFVVGKGSPNRALAKIWDAVPAEREKLNQSKEKIRPIDLLPSGGAVYLFEGSLTTPPCSEGVKWSVFENVISVPASQIETFRARYSNNARPVQSRNNRIISKVAH
jgi:carbonic anhydrase